MTRKELVREINLILEEYGHRLDEIEIKALNQAKEALQQEPKRGEWLDAREEDPCWYICSECKRMVDDDSNYCPNCGARMEVEE